MSIKNSIDTSWNRTSDLPICSTAHYIIQSVKNSLIISAGQDGNVFVL